MLTALAVAAASVFAVLWWQLQSREEERDDVRAFAEEFVVALTNFSYETIEQDAEQIRSYAIGQFKEEADVFFGDQAIEAIEGAEAESRGELESIFVESVDDGEASAFAVVSESITNATTTTPTTEIIRLHVEMVEADGEWKVNSVEVLQSPGSDPLLPGT